MKRLVPFCLACILLHGAPVNAGKPPAVLGDRQPQVEETYPEWLFVHKDEKNRVVDITQPPFNAKGDGVHDDTKAFVKAYDYVLARMYGERSWKDDDVWQHRADELLIYIPDGTYLVSDTLMYSGPVRGKRKKGLGGEGWYGEPLYGIRLIGQSRDGTTIRLKDHCPGYGMKDGKPSGKVVVGFTQAQFNNWPSGNAIRNITIDTGTGNPGAVGLNFHGANKCEIRNVTVRSRDRRGHTGILVGTGPTAGHFTDIAVQGFRRGIAVDTVVRATHVGWEYVTLEQQSEVGFLCRTSSTSIRHLISRNAVPALRVDGAGHAVLDRARLEGGAADTAALWIDSEQAQLFCRDAAIEGYGIAVRKAGADPVRRPFPAEYVSGKVVALRPGQEKRSLRLPVEEVPIVAPDPPARWASVNAFGAAGDGKTDDTDAVQRAMNSGKSTICFPSLEYRFGTVVVPPEVKRITGLFGKVRGRLRIETASDVPLVVEDASFTTVCTAAQRPIVMQFGSWCGFDNECGSQQQKLHLINMGGFGSRSFDGFRVWIRFVDCEYKKLPIYCNRMSMWIFGFKTEGGPAFEVLNGSRLEILGGTIGVNSRAPALYNNASDVSATFSLSDRTGWHERADRWIIAEARADASAGRAPAPQHPLPKTCDRTMQTLDFRAREVDADAPQRASLTFRTGPASTAAWVGFHRFRGRKTATFTDPVLAGPEGRNLLSNPGFETAAATGGSIRGWSGSRGTVEDGTMRLQDRHTLVWQRVGGLQPETTYTLSATVSGDDLTMMARFFEARHCAGPDLPRRRSRGGGSNVFVPLYVSYDAAPAESPEAKPQDLTQVDAASGMDVAAQQATVGHEPETPRRRAVREPMAAPAERGAGTYLLLALGIGGIVCAIIFVLRQTANKSNPP